MRRLAKCKSCGAEISKSTKTCPQCGAKRKGGGGCLIAVLVVLGLILIIAAVGGNSSEPEKVGSVGENNAVTATNPSAGDTDATITPPTGEPETTTEAKTVFTKGDVVSLNNINVTLVDVTESAGTEFYKPEDGNVFVLFEIELDNQSNKEIAVSSMMMFDAYFDDYAANFSLTAQLASNKNQLDGSLAAGKKMMV